MFYIGVDQVLYSAQLRTLNLFSELGISADSSVSNENKICCSSPLTDSVLELLDSSLSGVDVADADAEMSALYYICGYITKKKNLSQAEYITNFEPGHSEFTDLVSRGM